MFSSLSQRDLTLAVRDGRAGDPEGGVDTEGQVPGPAQGWVLFLRTKTVGQQISDTSGGWKSEVKVSAGWLPSEASVLGLSMAGRVPLCPNLFFEGHSSYGSRALSLHTVTSGAWRLGLQHKNGGRGTIQAITGHLIPHFVIRESKILSLLNTLWHFRSHRK